ncbi:Sec-independent protein translocase subunit TatA/TatB [Flaviaesturariibacter aridisoli]|nr:twin-arginine translocase TatA/TatE family subunit [Flaviaesturariibacter aridisoli]
MGANEIILIVVLVLILFGGRKIPELMRGLGRGVREFNDAKSNVRREIEEGMHEKSDRAAASTTNSASSQS